MNRLVLIVQSLSDCCAVCGGLQRVRVDIVDWGMPAILPCPHCTDAGPLRALQRSVSDYLVRPEGGDVA